MQKLASSLGVEYKTFGVNIPPPLHMPRINTCVEIVTAALKKTAITKITPDLPDFCLQQFFYSVFDFIFFIFWFLCRVLD